MNWQRWHALLDKRADEGLTPAEEYEFDAMQEAVVTLDAKEPGHDAVGRLIKKHEGIIEELVQLRKTIEALTSEDAE